MGRVTGHLLQELIAMSTDAEQIAVQEAPALPVAAPEYPPAPAYAPDVS